MAGKNPIKNLIDKAAASRERHQARHRPSGFGFVFADRLGYLDPNRWDAVTSSSSVFIQRPYLTALEEHGPSNITPRYAMIFRGEKPVAALALQVIQVSGRTISGSGAAVVEAGQRSPKSVAKSAYGKMRRSAVQSLNTRLLMCGNLMSWGLHGIAMAEDEDASAVWPAVAEAIYRVRRAEKLSSSVGLVMVKDFSPIDAEHGKSLRTFSYEPVQTDPDMVLDLKPTWTQYEGYLADLASKYRKGIVKMHKTVAEAGWQVESLSDPSDCTARIHDLYMQVHERAAVRFFTLKPEFIPALARSLGDNFRCTTVRREDEIAGFVTTIRDRDTAYGYFLGYDRQVNEDVPVYFRLLHAVIADAIAMGCRRVSLGRTALEPKAKLGARPVPLNVWVRHRHPIMNKLMRPLMNFVPHDEAPERSPFKNEVATVE